MFTELWVTCIRYSCDYKLFIVYCGGIFYYEEGKEVKCGLVYQAELESQGLSEDEVEKKLEDAGVIPGKFTPSSRR